MPSSNIHSINSDQNNVDPMTSTLILYSSHLHARYFVARSLTALDGLWTV
ncbi:hypothetical protein CULT_2530003 [[Clostridium] ultunense Esp]|nr:hypothetical protein CULT_2530003 [[Clostridium] ultunense Esp]